MSITLNGTTGITSPDINVTSQTTGFTTTGNLTAADLTLSGGVYLGGTGSANYLDDYEEGIWYPSYISWSVNPAISGTAKYTKIGRIVNVSVYLIGGTTVAGCSIEGLPFTVGTEASCLGTNGSISTLALTGTLYGGTTKIAAISGTTVLTGDYYAVTATYTI